MVSIGYASFFTRIEEITKGADDDEGTQEKLLPRKISKLLMMMQIQGKLKYW